jgi:hypothetical protein
MDKSRLANRKRTGYLFFMQSTSRAGLVPVPFLFLAGLTLICVGSGCGGGSSDDSGTAVGGARDAALFVSEIRPILAKKCVPCHNSETISGKLNLESRRTAFGGSDHGPFLVPGEPEASMVYRVTEKPHGDGAIVGKMPDLKGVFLSKEERELIRKWIQDGAVWPGGDEGWIRPRKAGAGEV